MKVLTLLSALAMTSLHGEQANTISAEKNNDYLKFNCTFAYSKVDDDVTNKTKIRSRVLYAKDAIEALKLANVYAIAYNDSQSKYAISQYNIACKKR